MTHHFYIALGYTATALGLLTGLIGVLYEHRLLSKHLSPHD